MPDQLRTLYKLMTMYTLSRVDFALTNSQITNVFLDLGYTNYFNVQYTLGDLVSSRLVHEEVYPDYRYYMLTDEGRESIEALKTSLAASIRSDYAVRCRVMEHTTALIDLTLTVPNETQAKIVSKEWKEKSQDVYAYIIHTLTQPDHIDRMLEEKNAATDIQ